MPEGVPRIGDDEPVWHPGWALFLALLVLSSVAYLCAIPVGDGEGKMHPFVTGGVGKMWYEMNSNYFDGATGTNDVNFGGGLPNRTCDGEFLACSDRFLRLEDT